MRYSIIIGNETRVQEIDVIETQYYILYKPQIKIWLIFLL